MPALERLSGRPGRAGSAISLHRRLDVRLTLLAMILLMAVSLSLVMLMRQHDGRASLEANQRMNIGLARYIVDSQPTLFDVGEPVPGDPLRDLAKQVMMINPALEVYLLDSQARIIAHALDGAGPIADRVNPAPFVPLLQADVNGPRLPVFGDDPRRPGRSAIFSVAAVNGTGGYLYVVLDGAGRERLSGAASVDSMSWSRDSLRDTLVAIGVLLTGAALAYLLALYRITHPLGRLTRQVQQIGFASMPGPAGGSGDEISLLANALAAMKQRIDEQFARLQTKERERLELVGNISHDLQTPLANVQGYVESLLLDDAMLAPVERQARLRIALRHAKRIGERIDNLFQLSGLQASDDRLQAEPFVLAELIHDIVDGYRLSAHAADVHITVHLSAAREAMVLADIASIDRLLQNLLDNALRHTPPGGTIRISTSPCSLADSQAGGIEVCIRDSGCGIDPVDLPYVFDRAWTGDRSRSDRHRVRGLGLAIARRIGERHGTDLQIESAPGRGTAVRFSLPLPGSAPFAASAA